MPSRSAASQNGGTGGKSALPSWLQRPSADDALKTTSDTRTFDQRRLDMRRVHDPLAALAEPVAAGKQMANAKASSRRRRGPPVNKASIVKPPSPLIQETATQLAQPSS